MKQYFDLLATYLRPQRPKVVVLAVLLVGDIGLTLANPQILRYYIDTTQAKGPLTVLLGAALLFLVIAFAGQIVASFATYWSQDVGWTATNRLRSDLLLHCLRLDMSFHKSRTPGEMLERVDGDVAALANFFSQFAILILGNFLFLLGVLVLVFREDWRVGLGLTLYAGIALGIMRKVQGLAVPHYKAYRQAAAEMSGFWEERIIATEDIRSSGAEAYTMRSFFQFQRNTMFKGHKAQLMGRAFQTTLEFLASFGLATTFTLCTYLLEAGHISIGTVYLIYYYTNFLSLNIGQITQQVNDLQGATASIERIRELYFTRSHVEDNGIRHVPTGPLAISFQNVSFSYVNNNPVLRNISFDLAAGKVLGIVGRTGSGKTTLTRLLSRFYDPDAGTIVLGDQEVRQIPLKELRQHIGVVTQDVQLFHASIRDNITFFDENIPDERIVAVLQALELGAWYKALPQGLDTILTPGGGLSAGEAQLLAFTRVFLRNPRIVILDEASSRLDPATERRIERAIDTLIANRTGIIIAHRLPTVQRADDILILEDGAIREYGPRVALAQEPTSRFYALLQKGLEEVLS